MTIRPTSEGPGGRTFARMRWPPTALSTTPSAAAISPPWKRYGRARARPVHPSRLAATDGARGGFVELARHREKNPASPNAYSRNDKAFIYGKTAIVVCEEVLDGGVLAATNIFIEELGSWRRSTIRQARSPSRSRKSKPRRPGISFTDRSGCVPGRSPAGVDQAAIAEQSVDLRPLRIGQLEVENLEIALQAVATGLGNGDDVRLVEQPAQCDLNRRFTMGLSDPNEGRMLGGLAARDGAVGGQEHPWERRNSSTGRCDRKGWYST